MPNATLSREFLTGEQATTALAAESSVFGRQRSYSPQRLARMKTVAERLVFPAFDGDRRAALAVAEAFNGAAYVQVGVQEALSTSDFPTLFGDILDRQLMTQYVQITPVWSMFASRITVRDFRPKKWIDLLGGRAILDLVPELTEYPARQVSEALYTLTVAKYGGRFAISWETLINDDLDELAQLPDRLATGASQTEDVVATKAVVTAAGPNPAFFNSTAYQGPGATGGVGNSSNLISGNPALTTDSLTAALIAINNRLDTEGRPVMIQTAVLMVPPALEQVARNIVNATEIRTTNAGGQQQIVGNWLAGRVKVCVNPWIPTIDTSANRNTTWYLLPAPDNNRPAVVLGFLRGHETPDLRMKASNSMSTGGGLIDPTEGSFEVDDIQYRARHVLGTTYVDPITTAVSNGSGS